MGSKGVEDVEVGEQLADLPVTTSDGVTTSLSALADGGPLVVFFYPKAFTPGCTAEACHFRDLAAEFAALGATRVGVSRDDVATQDRFAAEHGLDFPLVADPDNKLARALGAGRRGPLPSKRQTFVLDADLTLLARISSETDMERHADDALQVLRERTAG